MRENMMRAFARRWPVVALRGIVAVLFGIAALAWPHITLLVLVWLFGGYAVLDGVTALSVGIPERLWGLAALGVLGILAGVAAFGWPAITAGVLLTLIAAWAILTGILEIFAAVQLNNAMNGEWALGIGGALSVLLGVVLAADPRAGVLAVVWIIGLYAILFGILLLWLAWRLHGLAGTSHEIRGDLA